MHSTALLRRGVAAATRMCTQWHGAARVSARAAWGGSWQGSGMGAHSPPLAHAAGGVAVAVGARRAFMTRHVLAGGGGASDEESFYDNSVEAIAKQERKRLTMNAMIAFGDAATDEELITSARFVKAQLPVRLARRIVDMRSLPYIVITNPHMRRVYKGYMDALNTLTDFPEINTIEHEAEFTETLKELVRSSERVLEYLALGLKESQSKMPSEINLTSFLNQIIMSRIGRRVLAEQHIMLRERRAGYVGVIATELNLRDSILEAAHDAGAICHDTYGLRPKVKVLGAVHTTIPAIPIHINYIFVELFKNSMRAVVERSTKIAQREGRQLRDGDELPAIEVLLAEGTSVLTCRISDQGGGIAAGNVNKVFDYGFTTVKKRKETELEQVDDSTFGMSGLSQPAAARNSPMHGFGFGLPVARLYTHYFGGKLVLQNIEGYGVDAYAQFDMTGKVAENPML